MHGEGMVGSDDYKSLSQLNRLFSSKPWGMLHDISNHVPHPFNVLTRTPYQYRHYDLSFEQTCLDTAKKIVASTDKPISVSWSGGIDSTTALVALLKTAPTERLRIICNQQSIDEYPTFYQDVIHNKIEILDPSDWPYRASEFFTVSGDAGDTVWAAIDDSFYNLHRDNLHKSWKTWMVENTNVKLDIEFVERFCNWSGVEIRTLLDLRTWFYLCCKWQDKAMKIFYESPSTLSSPKKNLVAFYDVDDRFMMWTMNNLDKIIGNCWTDYKLPAKKFIYSFHCDDNYMSNKTKEYSGSYTGNVTLWKLLNSDSCFTVDENYQHHTLPSWPFIDVHEFESWNNKFQLIPIDVIEK